MPIDNNRHLPAIKSAGDARNNNDDRRRRSSPVSGATLTICANRGGGWLTGGPIAGDDSRNCRLRASPRSGEIVSVFARFARPDCKHPVGGRDQICCNYRLPNAAASLSVFRCLLRWFDLFYSPYTHVLRFTNVLKLLFRSMNLVACNSLDKYLFEIFLKP